MESQRRRAPEDLERKATHQIGTKDARVLIDAGGHAVGVVQQQDLKSVHQLQKRRVDPEQLFYALPGGGLECGDLGNCLLAVGIQALVDRVAAQVAMPMGPYWRKNRRSGAGSSLAFTAMVSSIPSRTQSLLNSSH